MLTMNRKLSTERARKILYGGDEPDFSSVSSDADMDLVLEKAIYWYRQNFKQSDAKKWVSVWLKSMGRDEDSNLVSRFTKSDLKMMAPYCRCLSRGFPATEQQRLFVRKNVNELLDRARKRVPTEMVERVSVRDRIEAKANELLCSLEPVIDTTIDDAASSRKKPNALLGWISSAELNKPMAVVVQDRLQATYRDLKAAHDGSDPDLVEGYSYMKPRSLKNLVEYFEEAIQNINDRLGVLRASRKPRKRKPKSVQAQIRGLRFLPRCETFGVDSVKVSDIIGSQGFVMFNTKNNKATVFVAMEPKSGLSVKGSTITGFDSAKSYEKTVRKPEDFVKNADGCRKNFTAAVRYLNGVKTKAAVPTGRVNKHCLVLQVQ